MNLANQIKLMKLLEQDHTVFIQSGYIDGPVHKIYELPEGIVYDSDVYTKRSLKNVSKLDVKVYKEITDWYQHQ